MYWEKGHLLQTAIPWVFSEALQKNLSSNGNSRVDHFQIVTSWKLPVQSTATGDTKWTDHSSYWDDPQSSAFYALPGSVEQGLEVCGIHLTDGLVEGKQW